LLALGQLLGCMDFLLRTVFSEFLLDAQIVEVLLQGSSDPLLSFERSSLDSFLSILSPR
jgi:hypothetical protein